MSTYFDNEDIIDESKIKRLRRKQPKQEYEWAFKGCPKCGNPTPVEVYPKDGTHVLCLKCYYSQEKSKWGTVRKKKKIITLRIQPVVFDNIQRHQFGSAEYHIYYYSEIDKRWYAAEAIEMGKNCRTVEEAIEKFETSFKDGKRRYYNWDILPKKRVEVW